MVGEEFFLVCVCCLWDGVVVEVGIDDVLDMGNISSVLILVVGISVMGVGLQILCNGVFLLMGSWWMFIDGVIWIDQGLFVCYIWISDVLSVGDIVGEVIIIVIMKQYGIF